jgi:peptidoglycan/xylan/chitin deacetylase (PgdA/CDA1 family)
MGRLILLLTMALSASSPAGALCDAPHPSKSSFVLASRPFAPPHQRKAVLSIDATWSRTGAEEILDTLASKKVTATFFLAGRFIRAYPDIVTRIVAEGHEVGNHTFSHDHLTRYGIDRTSKSLPTVTAESLTRELVSTGNLFEKVTGKKLAPLWRAPYGETNREILEWASRGGYTHVRWSEGLDTLDWVTDQSSRLYRSPSRGAGRVINILRRRTASEGPAIILMHLGTDRPPMERFANALPHLLDRAREIGYSFITATEALKVEIPQVRN